METLYSNRALTLALLGRHEEAEREATRALELDADRPYYAYAARGLVHLSAGRRDLALAAFDDFDRRATRDEPLKRKVESWRKSAP